MNKKMISKENLSNHLLVMIFRNLFLRNKFLKLKIIFRQKNKFSIKLNFPLLYILIRLLTIHFMYIFL